jgi:hypothetical protein
MAPRFTKGDLEAAVAQSLSVAETLRRLGLCSSGNNRLTFQRYVEEWEIDTSHFDPAAARRAGLMRSPTPLEEVLVEGSTFSRGHLKHRLFNEGLKDRRCEICGQDEIWRGRRMALILDHINGVRDDHRLENLRIVCPNCAATFDTHCGRKNHKPLGPRRCLHCNKEFFPKDHRRKYCSAYCGCRWDRHGHPRPGARRVDRPPYEQLMAEIDATSYSAVGRKYGVSDNAIRKWVRAYEREREDGGGG